MILLQTRQKYAGGLSPGKYFSRRMQQNLPKRHVDTLVKTGSNKGNPKQPPETQMVSGGCCFMEKTGSYWFSA